jgi:hypothetical protein
LDDLNGVGVGDLEESKVCLCLGWVNRFDVIYEACGVGRLDFDDFCAKARGFATTRGNSNCNFWILGNGVTEWARAVGCDVTIARRCSFEKT